MYRDTYYRSISLRYGIREDEKDNSTRHFTASRKGTSRARSAFVHGIGKIARIQGGRPRGVLSTSREPGLERKSNTIKDEKEPRERGSFRNGYYIKSAFSFRVIFTSRVKRAQNRREAPRGVLCTSRGFAGDRKKNMIIFHLIFC